MLIFSNYKLAIMEQTVKERLITFLKAKRLGQTKFEKLCGLSNGYINNLRHCPSAAKLAQILEAFPDLNRAWLLTGEGEMLTTTPAAPEKQPSSEGALRPAAAPHTVPLVPAYAAAGPQPGVDDIGVLASTCTQVYSPHPSAEIAIEVSGISMAPDFPPGCRVFGRRLRSTDDIRWGDIYIIETPDGAVIKRLRPADDRRYVTAESINPDYSPYRIPRADIRSLWRVLCHVVYQ